MKGCFTTLLLALIAAFIAAFFGRSCHQQSIENILNERVASEIKGSYPGVNVKYDHLTAMVSGQASETEAEEIKTKVKELAFGNGRVHFDLSRAPIVPDMPEFTIFRDANRITLNGTVDSGQTKAQLAQAALRDLGKYGLDNQIEVGTKTAAWDNFGMVTEAVPSLMKNSKDGKVVANPKKVVVSGTVESQDIKSDLLALFASSKWNNAEVVDQLIVKPTVIPRTIPANFTVLRTNNSLSLSGTVDSPDTRQKIEDAAKIDGLTVDNQIKVSKKVMAFPALGATVAGIPSLINSANNGKIEVKPEKVILSGLVNNSAAKESVMGYFSGDWTGPQIDDQITIKPSLPTAFALQRNNDKITLTGTVDSPRTKNMLGNAAKMAGVTVDNRIKVSDEVVAFPEFNSTLAGIPTLVLAAKNGKIDVSPEKIVLSGLVDNRNDKNGVLGFYSGNNWKGPKIIDRLKIKPSIPAAFSIQRTKTKLTLTGSVDSPATKTKLGNAAKMKGLTVDNQIKINEEVFALPELDATIAGIPMLVKSSENAKIDFTPQKIVFSGNMENQAAKDGLMAFYSADYKGPKVVDQIKVAPAAMPTPGKPSTFTIARTNNKLVLTGTVDSPDTKTKLGNAAKLEGVTVDNQLKVSNEVLAFPAMDNTVDGVPVLIKLAKDGKIQVGPDKVVLSGSVNNKGVKDGILGRFSSGWKGPEIVDNLKIKAPKVAPTFTWKQDEPKKALLSGRVPNAKVRDALVASAKKRLGPDAEVTDKMVIDSNVRNEPWLTALPVFAAQALPKVESPVINIDNKKSSFTGKVSNSTVMNDVSLAFSGINPPGKLTVNLEVVKPQMTKPPVMPSRTVIPDVEVTGKGQRLVVAGNVPNQKTHDMIVNTIIGMKNINHLDKKLKIADDVKEENYLEPLPEFIGKFYNGSVKNRELSLKNKKLTLKGILPSKEEKTKTLALADALKKKGITIIDQLTVEPPKIAMVEPKPPKVAMAPVKPPKPITDNPPPPVDPDKGELHSIYFGTGEFHIRDSQSALARKLVTRAKETSGKIVIDGYADERGSDDLNAFLSDERAKRIRAFLVENGIDQSRIVSVVGRGEIPNGKYREYRRTDVRIID